MSQKTIEFVALLLASLVMGVFWGTWFTLTRSIHDFSAAEFIHIGKVIINNVGLPMSILMPTTLVFMLLALLLSRRRNKAALVLYTIAFLLMVLTLVITVGIEVPIDNQIKTWTAEAVPADWETLRHKWEQYHTIRTFTSIGSVGFLALGMMSVRRAG